MKFEFVKYDTLLYKKAVSLRIDQFFKGMSTANDLIEDHLEKDSIHLICNINNDVVGTGRLSFVNGVGVISQMAIADEYQYKGVGTEIVNHLLQICVNKNIETVRLSARETAIGFYRNFGFRTIGEKYPSKKTGIIHQEMDYKLLK